MLELYIKQFSFLFTFLFSFILGIIIVCKNVQLYSIVIKLLTLLIFFRGIAFLFNHKDFKKGLFNIVIAFLFNFFPNVPLSFLPLMIAFYMLVLSLIHMITYFFYVKNDEKPRYHIFLKAFCLMILSWPLILTPLLSLKTVLIIIGIYVMIFGLFSLFDFLGEVIPQKTKKNLKRKIRITLPIFITTFIPYTVFKSMNQYLQEDKEELKVEKKNQPFDLEVLVHVSKEGSGMVGHVDLFYQGEVLSYGNYDMKSRKMKEAFGDGVLFIVKNKESYLEFCQKYSKKVLFGFGLRLTKEQKEAVDQEIKKIKENTVEWIPYYKRALINHEKIKDSDYVDYASSLYKTTGANFYKFKKGKFKSFFIFSTNCVQLVDTILGKTGTDIIKISGFISPGSYYDYLLREYCKKNSNVVSYHIYTEGREL